MSGSRLALVADDQRLASTIQTHLKKNLNQLPILACGFDNIRSHLWRESDGVVILIASTLAEGEHIFRLVQEISMQKLPPTLVVVEGDQLPPVNDLARLDRHVTLRMRWPDDGGRLIDFVRERVNRCRPTFGRDDESLEDVIGRKLVSYTPSLIPLVERIALAAAHDVTVLITGETGTGKTFLARLMHDSSPRRDHPFLPVACGALPPNLVESAFFGHTKGAFTGADRSKDGKFAAAGEGTILLDEIDTLGLEQQAGLLRVIETGEYEPVGSNETQYNRARLIVASNWDLEEAVEQGRFRRDLYYRLNVMSFHLPPLRERVQDISQLVRGMAARFATKFKKELFDISAEAMAALETFPWPGNIRQLENVMQQAVLLSSGLDLRPEHLPPSVREYSPPSGLNGNGIAGAHFNGNGTANGNGHGAIGQRTNGLGPDTDSLLHNRELLERNVIQRALANNGYSRARAASALGISRVTLYKKMKKYGLMSSPLRSNPLD